MPARSGKVPRAAQSHAGPNKEMNMNSFNRALAICGLCGLSLGVATADIPKGPGVGGGEGSATAQVVHPLTGRPVPGMPVYVVQIADPNTDGAPTFVFKSGPDGSALLSPLAEGVYQTWVEYNNNMSNIAQFEIDGETDFHPYVTLFFNPDIDKPD
jgi:hypothetical protein